MKLPSASCYIAPVKRLVLLALCCVAPLATAGAVALGAPATASADDEIPDSSFVQITLKKGDLELKHPGFDVNHDEQTIIELTENGNTHEFDIVLKRKGDKGPYKVTLEYRKNNNKVHAGELEIKPKKSKTLRKGDLSIEVMVDPNGGLDSSRRDKIDGPDSDDPLG